MSTVLSRRTALGHGLAAAGLGAAASVTAGRSLGRSDANSAHAEPVVIVGAGISGLAAAAELRAKGFADVVILEARDRIGGRIWTDTIGGDVPIDLGASWIHGVKGNPISAIASDNGIATAPTDYDNDVVHFHDGGAPPERAEDILDGFWSSARRRPRQSLAAAYSSYVATGELGVRERRYLAHELNTIVEHEFAADVGRLSLESIAGGREFRGGDVVFPGGYRQILHALVPGLDIRCADPVTSIDHADSPIVVTTASGATYETSAVIVTLPLGVLKEGTVSFHPALPAPKQRAIGLLAMGVLNKTCLLFDDVFWDEDAEIIGYVGPVPGQWAETVNLYPATGLPLLMMFNAASVATELERLSDADTVTQALGALGEMYGSTPQPSDARVTRWSSDPWSRGAYSYVPINASFEQYAELAGSIDNRLFFAGEATTEDYPATVHGAYLTGQRAASQLAGTTHRRRAR
ncbi:MAG: FAD-dependent oxidoreductase [Gammaproteobacteria bacterium]|nr:FAD-dependent oxidoreductase [Gammaproteobacteria bacterium]